MLIEIKWIRIYQKYRNSRNNWKLTAGFLMQTMTIVKLLNIPKPPSKANVIDDAIHADVGKSSFT